MHLNNKENYSSSFISFSDFLWKTLGTTNTATIPSKSMAPKIAAYFGLKNAMTIASNKPTSTTVWWGDYRGITPPLQWDQIPAFMNSLESWSGHYITKMALRLLSLTFVRTIELRRATWEQINFDTATWLIPAENMKMGRPHMVPLSRQTIKLLEHLHQVTGNGRCLLPNARRPDEPIGSTTLSTAIAALGYKGQFSAHGFRSTATTILSLLGYPDNRVDLQLAHLKRNDSSRAPYDHTKYISSRRILMQDWADIWDMFSEGSDMDDVTKKFGPISERRSDFLNIVEREQ